MAFGATAGTASAAGGGGGGGVSTTGAEGATAAAAVRSGATASERGALTRGQLLGRRAMTPAGASLSRSAHLSKKTARCCIDASLDVESGARATEARAASRPQRNIARVINQ